MSRLPRLQRAWTLGLAIAVGMAPPATAQTLFTREASPSYHPWLAAGLTYAPIALAAAPGAIYSDPVYPGLRTYGMALAVNPLPGMGQVYAGETVRGFAILGGGAAMLGAVAVANFAVNRRGRFSQFDPAPGFDPMPYINIGYFAASSLYSLWAAYDAYQLAERKNSRTFPLSPPASIP